MQPIIVPTYNKSTINYSFDHQFAVRHDSLFGNESQSMMLNVLMSMHVCHSNVNNEQCLNEQCLMNNVLMPMNNAGCILLPSSRFGVPLHSTIDHFPLDRLDLHSAILFLNALT